MAYFRIKTHDSLRHTNSSRPRQMNYSHFKEVPGSRPLSLNANYQNSQLRSVQSVGGTLEGWENEAQSITAPSTNEPAGSSSQCMPASRQHSQLASKGLRRHLHGGHRPALLLTGPVDLFTPQRWEGSLHTHLNFVYNMKTRLRDVWWFFHGHRSIKFVIPVALI